MEATTQKQHNGTGVLKRMAGCAVFVAPSFGHGHVKWFAEFEAAPEPVHWSSLLCWQLAGFLLLALMATLLAHWLQERVRPNGVIARASLDNPLVRERLILLLRVALLITVVFCWSHQVILAPELSSQLWLVPVLQLVIIVAGFTPAVGQVLPLGVLLLYLIAVYKAGLFHMLDYAFVLAVAGLLWAVDRDASVECFRRWLRVLYMATGFSLCWVALEKLIHPQWTGQILQQQPVLAMGLPHDFFIQGAAVVEFTLGFFFIFQLWPRLCALLLSGLMLLTLTIFGMVEMVGHLLLHAILLVFLLVGETRPGRTASYFRPLFSAFSLSARYGLFFVGIALAYYSGALA